ncbi:MAG: hypothetical protein ACFCUG_02135 [Thiotrichales bacterium]
MKPSKPTQIASRYRSARRANAERHAAEGLPEPHREHRPESPYELLRRTRVAESEPVATGSREARTRTRHDLIKRRAAAEATLHDAAARTASILAGGLLCEGIGSLFEHPEPAVTAPARSLTDQGATPLASDAPHHDDV